MKISLLTHNLDGKNGGGRFSNDLVGQLRLLDSTLDLKTFTTVDSGLTNQYNWLPTSKLAWLKNFFRLRQELLQSDVIQALDVFPYGIIAALCLGRTKGKLIITAIGSGSIKPLYNWWQRPLAIWAYRRAAKVTAISSYTAGEINKVIRDLAIQVITPGIDLKHFADPAEGLVSDNYVPYILSVGKIKKRKGYRESLKAFALISRLKPELHYVIVGSGRGDFFRELEALATELGVKEKVIFLENVPDQELAGLYRQAELFWLLPVNDEFDVEGFGLVYLEAAAFGLPVIGAKNSGAEDAILEGINGYLVDSNDSDSVATKLVAILNDKQLRMQFSAASLDLARQKDWRKIAQEYLYLYR